MLENASRAWPFVASKVTGDAWGTPACRTLWACLIALDLDGAMHGDRITELVPAHARRMYARQFDPRPAGDDSDAWDGVLGGGAEVLEMVEASAPVTGLRHDVTTLLDTAAQRKAHAMIESAYHTLDDPDADPVSSCIRMADEASGGNDGGWIQLADIEDPGSDRAVASWGIPEMGVEHRLDDAIPLCAGRHYIISGRPGGGKSSLAVQMMAANARAGRRSSFISMEMNKSDCFRFFRSHSLTRDEMRFIDILDCGHLTPSQIQAAVKTGIRRRCPLIVIDHLSFIRSEGKQTKWEAICTAANFIVGAVKMSDCSAVLSIAQMTKSGRAEDKKGESVSERPPSMDDIEGGADVGNGAAFIGILWRPQSIQKDALSGEQMVRLAVAKSRFTSRMNVDFRFRGATHTFTRDKVDVNNKPDTWREPAETRRQSPIDDDTENLFGGL